MFKKMIAKLTHKSEKIEYNPMSDEVTLKALCAYRDELVKAEDCDFIELVSVQLAIQDTVHKMPVSI